MSNGEATQRENRALLNDLRRDVDMAHERITRQRDDVVKERRWLIGVGLGVLMTVGGVAIGTWARSNENARELDRRSASVDSIPVIQNTQQQIKEDLAEVKGDVKDVEKKVDRIENAVNRIAIKVGAEPE